MSGHYPEGFDAARSGIYFPDALPGEQLVSRIEDACDHRAAVIDRLWSGDVPQDAWADITAAVAAYEQAWTRLREAVGVAS